MNILDAYSVIARLAEEVGFKSSPIPFVDGAPTPMEGSFFLAADYAQILLIQSTGEESAILSTSERGQEWLDLSCTIQEQTGQGVVDGYLVIALNSAPEKAARQIIRQIELDPTSCRKHFVWPAPTGSEADLAWSRIFRITAVGLPQSPVSYGMTNTPILDSALEIKLLEDIKALRGANAARQHAENEGLAPDDQT